MRACVYASAHVRAAHRYSPSALRYIRDRAPMPIASLESLLGRRAILPFLQAEAVDVCIIDPLWNGLEESVKMAALCDTFEVGR
jgi:galactonate dehydratase